MTDENAASANCSRSVFPDGVRSAVLPVTRQRGVIDIMRIALALQGHAARGKGPPLGQCIRSGGSPPPRRSRSLADLGWRSARAVGVACVNLVIMRGISGMLAQNSSGVPNASVACSVWPCVVALRPNLPDSHGLRRRPSASMNTRKPSRARAASLPLAAPNYDDMPPRRRGN